MAVWYFLFVAFFCAMHYVALKKLLLVSLGPECFVNSSYSSKSKPCGPFSGSVTKACLVKGIFYFVNVFVFGTSGLCYSLNHYFSSLTLETATIQSGMIVCTMVISISLLFVNRKRLSSRLYLMQSLNLMFLSVGSMITSPFDCAIIQSVLSVITILLGCTCGKLDLVKHRFKKLKWSNYVNKLSPGQNYRYAQICIGFICTLSSVLNHKVIENYFCDTSLGLAWKFKLVLCSVLFFAHLTLFFINLHRPWTGINACVLYPCIITVAIDILYTPFMILVKLYKIWKNKPSCESFVEAINRNYKVCWCDQHYWQNRTKHNLGGSWCFFVSGVLFKILWF